jgi:hypothetical protein
MAVQRATEFEVLRVLHTFWKDKDMDIVKIKTILKETYDMELTVLANGEIAAQSTDGKIKYSIK